MLLLTMVAFADAIDEEPTDCPKGSTGHSDHLGPRCEPTWCDLEIDLCPTEDSCEQVGLCLSFTERGCGGDSEPDCTQTVYEISGTCTTQSDCSSGTCEIADRCVSPAQETGCNSVGAPISMVLLGLLPFLFRRTRPRSE